MSATESNHFPKAKQLQRGRVNGEYFDVPLTRDVAVAILVFAQIIICLSNLLPRAAFLILFVIWRIAYNGLLGVLLRQQSSGKYIVRWCKRNGFAKDAKKRSQWAAFLISQMQRKMGTLYDYESVPLEFNAWILFRGLVDLVLVNDVASFIIFCYAYFERPVDLTMIDILRYAGGICAFNVWVKADAHRVVKDFAWYWGDFFFLIDASLVFDGVFEMAPHPMYSVGYMWLYGASLITKSYWVLFVSVFAHASQFAFLYFVENPHIEKTYNTQSDDTDNREVLRMYFRRDLIVFKNFDCFRSTDLLSAGIAIYAGILSLTSSINFCIGHALIWRIFHTYILGAILHYQSKDKFWTRHFIKFGDRPRDAFAHWKTIYNLSQLMLYTTFFICVWKLLHFAPDEALGDALFRVTFGIILILLHMWTSVSVYEVIGDLGWFYGDFFIGDIKSNAPRYTGIYRFLNNPEKIIGQAAFWGGTLISSSYALFALTLFGQISTWLFLRHVERPHMAKLYGNQIRDKSGVEKMLQKEVDKIEKAYPQSTSVLKKMVQNWEDFPNSSQFNSQTSFHEKEDVSSAVDDDTAISEQSSYHHIRRVPTSSPRKESMVRVSSVIEAVDAGRKVIEKAVGKIHISYQNQMIILSPRSQTFDATTIAKIPEHLYNLRISSHTIQREVGCPLRVQFNCPISYAKGRDWIGIYEVGSNSSETQTTSQSEGHWQFISGNSDMYYASEEDFPFEAITDSSGKIGGVQVNLVQTPDHEKIISGELIFRGFLLPWKAGRYELRYHFNGKYNVLAISEPFDLVMPAQDQIPDDFLLFVDRCLDCTGVVNYDPSWARLDAHDDIIKILRLRIGSSENGIFIILI